MTDNKQQDYQEFLRAKMGLAPSAGFDVSEDEVHPLLLPHQRQIVVWAIKAGRRGGGSELNPAYFLDSLTYLRAAEEEFMMPSLFSLETAAESAAETEYEVAA